eukprot:403365087
MKQPQEYKIEDDDELQEKLQEEKTQTFQAPKIRLKPYIPVIVKGIAKINLWVKYLRYNLGSLEKSYVNLHLNLRIKGKLRLLIKY